MAFDLGQLSVPKHPIGPFLISLSSRGRFHALGSGKEEHWTHFHSPFYIKKRIKLWILVISDGIDFYYWILMPVFASKSHGKVPPVHRSFYLNRQMELWFAVDLVSKWSKIWSCDERGIIIYLLKKQLTRSPTYKI